MDKNIKREVIKEFLEWIERQGWVICESGQGVRGDYFHCPIYNIDGIIDGFLRLVET